MTTQMNDKEIIEGLQEAIVDALDWNYLDDNADEEIGAIRAKYISLFQAAISRLQSIQWRPIEEIPEEWKDGRQVDLIISGELEMGCCFLKSPNGWNCGPHDEWYSDGDKYITHIRLPEDLSAFNQEEE